MSLIVDLDTLMGRDGKRCELARTGTITPETARRILCDAGISRFIVQGDSVPLDMGRQVRTATSAQGQAPVLRDAGCTHPGCDAPPEWCDVHHITHWLNRGRTDLDNLTLLCRRHHLVAHADDDHRRRRERRSGRLRSLAPELEENVTVGTPEPHRSGDP